MYTERARNRNRGITMKHKESEPAPAECVSPRFSCWCGRGLPKAWADNIGIASGDVVWPIVDRQTCGPIRGYPTPEQMLCWCPSQEKQSAVVDLLRRGCGLDVDEAWKAL